MKMQKKDGASDHGKEKDDTEKDGSKTKETEQSINDPLSQFWYSPGFYKSCDKTVERYTRVEATGAPSFSLDYSPLDEENPKKA